MRRQGLVARRIRRRNGLTRQGPTKAPFPDLSAICPAAVGTGTARVARMGELWPLSPMVRRP